MELSTAYFRILLVYGKAIPFASASYPQASPTKKGGLPIANSSVLGVLLGVAVFSTSGATTNYIIQPKTHSPIKANEFLEFDGV